MMNNARPIITALMIYALAVASLIPPGFMPGQGADGKNTIVICIGAFEAEIPNPDEGDTPNHTGEGLCAYTPVLAAEIPVTPHLPNPSTIHEAGTLALARLDSQTTHPYHGRAPPHLISIG